jgi:hypothetical protein
VSIISQFILFLFNIFLSFSSPHEVQANPRSSDGGEEDRKSEKSERSEHSEPQQPEPETGQKTLPTIWGTYMKFVTTYQMSAINSCWGKCDKKWVYTKCMFKVKKNQQSPQTGSMNLMGPKTIPKI